MKNQLKRMISKKSCWPISLRLEHWKSILEPPWNCSSQQWPPSASFLGCWTCHTTDTLDYSTQHRQTTHKSDMSHQRYTGLLHWTLTHNTPVLPCQHGEVELLKQQHSPIGMHCTAPRQTTHQSEHLKVNFSCIGLWEYVLHVLAKLSNICI